MARVAIVSYDVQTIFGEAGGVGAFTTRLANLLRQAGESVSIVMTRIDWEPMRVDAEWRARFQTMGIDLIELQSPPPLTTRWPEVPTMRVAEIAAAALKGFDVVYFQDWGNAAFHLVRERRYLCDQGPVCVTVLHGPSEWELSSNHKYPHLPSDLHLAYQERYAAQHSDLVVSPSRYMVGQLKDIGWVFPGEIEVLGLPMPEPPRVAEVQHLSLAPIRRIVYFGRVEERKGIRNFVKALEHLAPSLGSRPEVVLLGRAEANDDKLLEFAMKGIRKAGFAVSHKASLDSEAAQEFLRGVSAETICVVPSPADNHPYSVVEASLIPGLNLIVTDGGGIPEILGNAAAQISGPHPMDLAAKIAERLRQPLAATELAQYDCATANQRWLGFHARAVALAATRRIVAPVATASRPGVDVCVTYYQKSAYLPQLVDALERQTETDFHVIAVNDGSPDENSNRVFEEYADKTKSLGWDFFRQENAFVDAARNNAARRGSSELILFVDADDVPSHNTVARLREAINRSGDDALIPAMYLFASEDSPLDPVTGEVRVPAFATCIPLGIDLVGGLINPCAFGGSMFMVRRSVFEQMHGFRELRGAGNEDWEFYVRMVLAGYKVDILPEILQFYRQVEGSLARTLHAETSMRRLIDAYEDGLRPLGLQGAALALSGLHRSSKRLEGQVAELSVKVNSPRARYAFFSTWTGRFETDASGMEGLRKWYREHVSMETRLKLHRLFLAPFFGEYKVPGHKTPPA
jgi:GT2 family glycosyltransferase/glycosyltransferase involved in cell wall biosynthesis